ncbi:MAG: helix-turn-helix transcriptional regulator [Lachnospiraceae bacterium]|nr:helix-turn-helix transcriptional regulator [Lachnospiraceae bacterium]
MAKNINYYMELHGKSRNEICEALGVKYTTFSDWVRGNAYPRIDKIEMLANYFGIEKSDLVEDKSKKIQLTEKDEKDIAKRLEAALEDLENQQEALMFSGEPLDDHTRELLKASLENSIRIAKINAKEKYTPKKYKKD